MGPTISPILRLRLGYKTTKLPKGVQEQSGRQNNLPPRRFWRDWRTKVIDEMPAQTLVDNAHVRTCGDLYAYSLGAHIWARGLGE